MSHALPHAERPDALAWRALHDAAVVVPLAAVGAIRLTGPDRVAFLNGQLANDVRSCPQGGSVRSLYLDPKGHALDEVRVQCRAEDLHVAVEDGRLGEVRERLAAHRVFDDVEIRDLSSTLATLTMQGRASLRIVGEALGVRPDLAPGSFEQLAREGGDVLVVPHRRSGPGGVDLHLLRHREEEIRAALVRAGATLADVAVLEASRVEAGLPRAARDAGPGVLPQEAGLRDAVSTTKGCYLGQETMARIEARARVRRGLARLRLDRLPGGVPAGGATRPDVLLDERPVGRLGSLAVHPDLGPIALAVLRTDLPLDATLRVGDVDAAILAP